MELTNLDTSLLDMIQDGYELHIERSFGYIYVTLHHGIRTESVRIHQNIRPTDKNLKTVIVSMVEKMKKEETL